MKKLIIIPAYNEEKSLLSVIQDIRDNAPGYDYVVINDASTDGTKQLCEEHQIHFLDLASNLGIGGAVQTGYQYALQEGYDLAVQLDGDGQHPAAALMEMEQFLRTDEEDAQKADLVIGSRFVTEKKPKTLRMIGNTIIEAAIRLTTGKKLTDPTSGMRLYNRKLIRELAYGVNYSPEPDTVAYLLRCGAQVEETQVTVRERAAGESYLSMGRSIRYMTLMCMNILFIQWVRKRSETV